MSAKNFTLLTFGSFVLMATFVVVVVFAGGEWRGGNKHVAWLIFGMCAIQHLGFISFKRRWAMTKPTARQLRTFDPSITLEVGQNILQKYSYFLLISSCIFFVAGVAALFIY